MLLLLVMVMLVVVPAVVVLAAVLLLLLLLLLLLAKAVVRVSRWSPRLWPPYFDQLTGAGVQACENVHVKMHMCALTF